MHLTEGQLIACLEGEANETVKQHVETETCDACRARIEAYTDLQSGLLRALYRRRCPASQTLSDFHLGLLTGAEAAAVKEHLTECPHCAAELEGLRRFMIASEPSA